MSILSAAACPSLPGFQNIIKEHMTFVNDMTDTAGKVNKLFVVYHFSTIVKNEITQDASIVAIQNIVSVEKPEPIKAEDIENANLFAEGESMFSSLLGYACYIRAYHFQDNRLLSAQRIYQECNSSLEIKDKIQKLESIFTDKCEFSFLKSLQEA